MVLQILHQSMQPLLASLQAWLYQGLLQAPAHNFFIREGRLCFHMFDAVQTCLCQVLMQRLALGQLVIPHPYDHVKSGTD